jgi:hypothetical protein
MAMHKMRVNVFHGKNDIGGRQDGVLKVAIKP